MIRRRGVLAEPRADHRSGRDGDHVLGRPADLAPIGSSLPYSRNDGVPSSPPATSRNARVARPRRTAAAGCPAAISSAKFGPLRIAAGRPGCIVRGDLQRQSQRFPPPFPSRRPPTAPCPVGDAPATPHRCWSAPPADRVRRVGHRCRSPRSGPAGARQRGSGSRGWRDLRGAGRLACPQRYRLPARARLHHQRGAPLSRPHHCDAIHRPAAVAPRARLARGRRAGRAGRRGPAVFFFFFFFFFRHIGLPDHCVSRLGAVPHVILGLDGWRWVAIIGATGAIVAWFLRLALPSHLGGSPRTAMPKKPNASRE